jgi:iron complex outermembrane recepter protein
VSNKSKTRLVLLPLASALAATSGHAQGSKPAEALQEVQVLAERQPFRGDIPLQDLPQSVQVLSAELLGNIGVTQLDDVLDLASGVARQNTFGGLWDSFAIRGFAGDENSPTGYLVNGFNNGRGFSGRRDASNIERVEVLKGPGSALYGRSEPGGTLNLVTKKPKFESEGSLELQLARFDSYRVAADYTTGITDSIAFRVNGAWQEADSFRDFISSSRYNFTPSLLFRLGDSSVVTYELEIVKQSAPFDRGIVAPGGVLGPVPPSRFLGEPGDGDTDVAATGHQLSLQHEFNADWTLHAGVGYRTSSFEGFSSDPELVAGRQPFYADGTNLSRQRRERDYDTKDLTARAEISGSLASGPLTHHVLFGADYYDYEFDQVQTRFRPTLANAYSVNVFNPVYGQVRTPGAFVNSLEKQNATGIYFQDQIDLTERWKALVGVRHDKFDQDITNRATSVTTSQSDSATSPRFGLVFEPSDALSLYASFSRGFRPNGGFDARGTSFKPEISKSYEIGTKFSAAEERINATVALYKAEKSNVLTSDPINAGFSIAAGEAESRGVEVDVTGQITDDLTLNFAYAYTDAEVSKSVLDVNFGLNLPAGSRLINIPKNSANLLLIQGFNVGTSRVTAGIGATYVSDRLGETGVPSFVLPSYTLVNLTASYAPSDSFKVTVDLDNALDKTFYPSSYARLWIAPGAPRTWTVRGVFNF